MRQARTPPQTDGYSPKELVMVSMVSYVERTVYTVEGHRVAVVSWYDAHLRTWRASAPDYPYLIFARSYSVPLEWLSREAVIRHVLTHFTQFFRAHGGARPPIRLNASDHYMDTASLR